MATSTAQIGELTESLIQAISTLTDEQKNELRRFIAGEIKEPSQAVKDAALALARLVVLPEVLARLKTIETGNPHVEKITGGARIPGISGRRR